MRQALKCGVEDDVGTVVLTWKLHLQDVASTMRWLWADPESGRPARLQLVVGATLERRLGPVALSALLDKV